MILLDTCTFIWLTTDPKQLSKDTLGLIENSEQIWLSAISALEIGTKIRKGKLRLHTPLAEWLEKSLRYYGITESPITIPIATLATELPPIHSDPADRILIATALVNKLTLLTPDEKIRSYPHVKTLWS